MPSKFSLFPLSVQYQNVQDTYTDLYPNSCSKCVPVKGSARRNLVNLIRFSCALDVEHGNYQPNRILSKMNFLIAVVYICNYSNIVTEHGNYR